MSEPSCSHSASREGEWRTSRFAAGGPGRPDDGGQVRAVDRLALKQQADDPVEGVAMPAEQAGRRVLGLPEQPGYFLVDGALRFLGIRTADEGVVAARSLRPVADGPDLRGESPLPHHVRRELGRAREVACAGVPPAPGWTNTSAISAIRIPAGSSHLHRDGDEGGAGVGVGADGMDFLGGPRRVEVARCQVLTDADSLGGVLGLAISGPHRHRRCG
jgi:hypothetical protein